jgi:phytoene synthase
MQLTNIARDVYEDACMGRRYLPSNWVDNLSPSQIVEAATDPNSKNATVIKQAILTLLKLSDTYYNSGVKGLVSLPWKAHLAIGIAAFVYRRIGIQLCQNQVNWYNGRTVTSNFTKFQSSCAALFLLLARFKTLPKHDTKLHQPLTEKLDFS